MNYRYLVKQRMVLDRIAKFGKPLCDLCQTASGTEMHEIIPRGKTVGNVNARLDSFNSRLCALLCAKCHRENGSISSKKALKSLFKRLMELYGEDDVKSAVLEVPARFRTHIDIEIMGKDDANNGCIS